MRVDDRDKYKELNIIILFNLFYTPTLHTHEMIHKVCSRPFI